MDNVTVADLIRYLSHIDPDTPVVLREDDSHALYGPFVTLEDILYELEPVSDDARSNGPRR